MGKKCSGWLAGWLAGSLAVRPPPTTHPTARPLAAIYSRRPQKHTGTPFACGDECSGGGDAGTTVGGGSQSSQPASQPVHFFIF